MKKNFIFPSLLLLIAVICGYSCSDNESETNEQKLKEPSFGELSKSIEKCANEFGLMHKDKITSRGSWGRFWRAVRADVYTTVTTDIYGNKNAKPVFSTGTSRKKWKDSGATAVTYDLLTNDNRFIVDSLYAVYDSAATNPNCSAGVVHNALLLSMIKNNTFNYERTLELSENLLRECDKYDIDISDLSKQEVASKIEDFFTNIFDEDDDVLCSNLISRYPNHTASINIIKQCMNELYKYEDVYTVHSLSSELRVNVRNSTIGGSDKDMIIDALSIAEHSYELWSRIGAF